MVTIDIEDEENDGQHRHEALTQKPEQLEVGKIDTLGFFGESALLEHGERNATVAVSSDRCELLRLKRSDFLTLMQLKGGAFTDEHENRKSVLDRLKETQMERMERNRNHSVVMERRRSGAIVPLSAPKMDGAGLGLGGSGKRNDRSLFS